jgi:hypothetical protein
MNLGVMRAWWTRVWDEKTARFGFRVHDLLAYTSCEASTESTKPQPPVSGTSGKLIRCHSKISCQEE